MKKLAIIILSVLISGCSISGTYVKNEMKDTVEFEGYSLDRGESLFMETEEIQRLSYEYVLKNKGFNYAIEKALAHVQIVATIEE